MRKKVKLMLADEIDSVSDCIDVELPLVRKVTISEFIALTNAFFLLLRRNGIEDDVDIGDIDTVLPNYFKRGKGFE